MRTYVVEYLDDEGDIRVFSVDPGGIKELKMDESVDFPEPAPGQIGISLFVESKDDLIYEGATRNVYQRIAVLGVTDEAFSSEVTADLFLAEPHIYEMLEEVYSDFQKEYPESV